MFEIRTVKVDSLTAADDTSHIQRIIKPSYLFGDQLSAKRLSI